MRVEAKTWLGLVVAGLMASPAIAVAQVPGKLPVQGVLTDADGVPLDGAQTVQFRIYDAESAGTTLHNETQTVACASGVFTVYLGTTSTLDMTIFDGQSLWLGIKVGSDAEMTPRLEMGSVPYAGYAGDAAELGGVAAASYLTTSSQTTIEGWAEGVCYDTEAELTGALNDNYAATAHTHDSAGIVDGSIAAADLASQSVTPAKLANCSSVGQILKYTGANTWSCVSEADVYVGDITAVNAGSGITVTNSGGPTPTVAITTGGVTNAMLATGIDAAKLTGTIDYARYDAHAEMVDANRLKTGVVSINTTCAGYGGYCETVSFGTTISSPRVVISAEYAVPTNNYCTMYNTTNTGFGVWCSGNTNVNWIAMY